MPSEPFDGLYPDEPDAADITAAILVSLLRQGAPADLLECLTHGVDRYLPPNALRKAVDHALVRENITPAPDA